jgi:hypothetical protein
MKFYRYVIYKLYSGCYMKKNDTPVLNVIITLSLVHFFQLLSIGLILDKIFPQINLFKYKIDKLYIALGTIIFGLINYFLFYNKKRWESYLEEFKDGNLLKGNIGTILVFYI